MFLVSFSAFSVPLSFNQNENVWKSFKSFAKEFLFTCKSQLPTSSSLKVFAQNSIKFHTVFKVICECCKSLFIKYVIAGFQKYYNFIILTK